MTSMTVDKAVRLLNARVPLLIWGELGTGKTTFARLAALRLFGNAGNFVHVDCATFAVESAISPSVQRALLRDRACLILDRLEELNDSGQKALLNLLENDLQLGPGQIGVIALAATDLDQMRKDGKLRPGLLHRLKGGSIVLPPLRNSPDLEGVMDDLLMIELKEFFRQTWLVAGQGGSAGSAKISLAWKHARTPKRFAPRGHSRLTDQPLGWNICRLTSSRRLPEKI